MIKKSIGLVMFYLILAVFYYHNWRDVLGICLGVIWGFLNFYFIQQLMHCVLLARKRSLLKICLFAFIKFPFLYAIGYELLTIESFSSWNLLIGFSLVLVAYVQSGLWNHWSLSFYLNEKS